MPRLLPGRDFFYTEKITVHVLALTVQGALTYPATRQVRLRPVIQLMVLGEIDDLFFFVLAGVREQDVAAARRAGQQV